MTKRPQHKRRPKANLNLKISLRASARETRRINNNQRPMLELQVKMVKPMALLTTGKNQKLRSKSRFKRPRRSAQPSTLTSSKRCMRRFSIVSVRTW